MVLWTGHFPATLPEPSPDGLKGLAALVLASNAAFGIAHDGDADRAVFIDENGSFVEENQEFALIAQHICRNAKGTIVTPVSTSQMVEMVAVAAGCTVQYTPVGSIYVARTMRELIANGKQVVFGGEGNGGLIFPKHQFCRDGGNDRRNNGRTSRYDRSESLHPCQAVTPAAYDKRKDLNCARINCSSNSLIKICSGIH